MRTDFLKCLYTILIITILVTAGITGCEDDTVSPPPPPPVNDTSQVNFNNLVISELTIATNTSQSAVDLYKGVIVVDSNRIKDANLFTEFTIPPTYYFTSGHSGDNVNLFPGYVTKFRFVYSDLTQAQFDTMKSIPGTDSILTGSEFTIDRTQAFANPLNQRPVYGFYLKGKYDEGYVPNRVFGVMYIDSTYTEAGGFKLKFDVKINKNSENKFRSQ